MPGGNRANPSSISSIRCLTGKAVVALAICAILLSLSSCSIPRNQVRDVAQGDGWRVRLIKFATKDGVAGKGGFEHPVDITIVKLNNILGAIEYKDRNILDSSEPIPLFPRKTRALLLRPLYDALTKAGPDEVVDFSFMYPKGFLGVFSRDLFSSGIMFKKDGRLHLVMRTVNFLVEGYFDASKQFVGDPTRRALAMDWEFIPGPGMELVKNPKKGMLEPEYFYNWLSIDLNYPFPVPSKKLRRKRRSVLPEDAAPVYQTPPTLEDDSASAPVTAPAPRPATVAPVNKLDDPEVRRELDILRELYNSGAISRSTYERRKNELLSR